MGALPAVSLLQRGREKRDPTRVERVQFNGGDQIYGPRRSQHELRKARVIELYERNDLRFVRILYMCVYIYIYKGCPKIQEVILTRFRNSLIHGSIEYFPNEFFEFTLDFLISGVANLTLRKTPKKISLRYK